MTLTFGVEEVESAVVRNVSMIFTSGPVILRFGVAGLFQCARTKDTRPRFIGILHKAALWLRGNPISYEPITDSTCQTPLPRPRS